ncbi:hypothetical protein PVAP13_3NG221342 [Panicum virgatum]|uniref:Uncharacterized protein n=1 Tax=Panicum virgatum TaxID=38727 RepID=A0A8T0U8R7_PANVG|nr:hypothetical protein PVAP13_3NG221342 [Panicum virgatum]
MLTGRSGWPQVLLLVVLALVCVVALGRAPAVCCCTCAASWLCPRPEERSADSGRR